MITHRANDLPFLKPLVGFTTFLPKAKSLLQQLATVGSQALNFLVEDWRGTIPLNKKTSFGQIKKKIYSGFSGT